MARATGIGGVFFRAQDPELLAGWYARHLGIDLGSGVWMQAAGPTVFAPFARDSAYFGTDRSYMINLRIDDLDTLNTALTTAGIACETRTEGDSAIGRFARIHDPEGNPIELWQPAEIA